jgi:hypothetical protein
MRLLLLLATLVIFSTSKIPDIPPPGTIKMGTNRYLDRQLITHLDYAECITWLETNEPFIFPKMLTNNISNTGFLKLRPELSDLPVTGLSKDQIRLYCSWRSQKVNQLKSNTDNQSCSKRLRNKWMKQDPDNQWEINYDIPDREDLKILKRKKINYKYPEWATDNQINLQDEHSIPNELVFRCVARYQKK